MTFTRYSYLITRDAPLCVALAPKNPRNSIAPPVRAAKSKKRAIEHSHLKHSNFPRMYSYSRVLGTSTTLEHSRAMGP
ncbi:unnamed protein product [Tuber melanosporum]|uniref:(Perigord truffle) hypothetical protein n=1 Tax=Tuber melanosporum (strain Mel28) TaxID=656061 RepID=D5GPT7_TUBMM|nr:uncharacterized protein GSTUM_00012026001 [Tuber melanosporum]CAZ86530.1 unnamed protein product [Tuber melanosporum]